MPVVKLNKWSYKLVEDKNDGLGKVPAYDEEAFQLGITFKAKYVGTLEITRPTCRAEIVTAMRKVRYEFKIKGIVKRRVNVIISVDGIKVTLRKRRRRMRKERMLDEEPVVLHEHQIGRIFYVSHDSMDLKIFSYITKDNFDNQFRCSVFKAYRKSKALFIVRTIGQAFEVCHRLQQPPVDEKKETEKTVSQKVDEGVLADAGTDIDDVDQEKLTEDASPNAKVVTDIDERVTGEHAQTLVDLNQLLPPLETDGTSPPFTVEQLHMLFNQRLEHYIQETEVFKAENQLLKDQLVLERSARIQAQEGEHCLLKKNHELLQTVQSLANRLQTVIPGDNSLSLALKSSNHDHVYNASCPLMFSTPLNKDHNLDHFIGSNSIVIPAIPPPPDMKTTFETDRKFTTDLSRMAPLATMECDTNGGLQSTVGLYWKTFDEDDDISPENGLDDSSSESSDDELYLDACRKQENDISVKMANGVGLPNLNGENGGTMNNMYTKPYPNQHNNGVVSNGLHHLPTQTENNNNFEGKSDTNEVRTAIQTDF